MRFSARFIAAALALLGAASAVAEPPPVEIVATPIERFDIRTPVGARYGALIFLGGLQLRSENRDFGGLSGLRLSDDGARFTAISDRGNWFTGAIIYVNSRPIGLSDVTVEPTPGRDGAPLPGRRGFDTEALEIRGRTAFVTSERVHWLTRYDLGPDGFPQGRGAAVALPKAMASAPRNAGFEAMAALRTGSIVMIGEDFRDDAGDNRAFVVATKTPFEFSVRRADDFSPTDLARLPDGDFLLLERRYRPPFSLAIRIKRLAERDIRPGALVDGPALLEATLAQTIDNFEAMSVHRGTGGATVITLLSDNNFSVFQRILLMQFALAE